MTTNSTDLNRQDAIQWCLENLSEFTVLGIMGKGAPKGWVFMSQDGELILCHTIHDPIKKVDFEMARKPRVYIGDTPEQMRKGTPPWVPEAGERCEYKSASGGWFNTVIIGADSDGLAVFELDECDITYAEMSYDSMRFESKGFRPLRTQEETEREEGIKALTEILARGVGDCEPDVYLAAAVWDAGYRLIEK